MQATGSFKIPQFDVRNNRSLIGQGHVPTIVRIEAKLLFLSALKTYLHAIAERVPVLTGETKEQVYGIIERVDGLLEGLNLDYTWRLGLDDNPLGLSVNVGSVSQDLTPTARQYPDSPDLPVSPDPGREYKEGVWYDGARRKSRGEWRSAAERNTKGDFDALYSITNGAWIQNFYFEVRTFDSSQGKAYYPEVYRTADVLSEIFTDTLSEIYPQRMIKVLEIFTGGGGVYA